MDKQIVVQEAPVISKLPLESSPSPSSSKISRVESSSMPFSHINRKAKRIVISIVVVGVVLLVAIIIVSIVIARVRREVDTVTLNISVTDMNLWQTNPITLCDPYNWTQSLYRLNFYSGPSSFVHKVQVWQTGENNSLSFVGEVIVPQESTPSSSFFSLLLQQPGTYLVENSANGTSLGTLLFTYPNPCNNTQNPQ